jgi:pimeloyl-ACP methyl ester carboxylesterase
MAPLLLLSGAGLPSWIWDDLRAALDVESRVASRPDSMASLAQYADRALADADGWDTFHVVAHSAGGVVGSELVARAPDRVAGFLGISACIPEDGGSFLAAQPFPQRLVLGLVVRLVGTRPPAKEIREGLCLGASPEQAERIVEEFVPESPRLYRDPASPRTFPNRSSYLLTERDTQFRPEQQQVYAARLGGRVRPLSTAHLPMLERPGELAEAVTEALDVG